jgi:hypothetical protein
MLQETQIQYFKPTIKETANVYAGLAIYKLIDRDISKHILVPQVSDVLRKIENPNHPGLGNNVLTAIHVIITSQIDLVAEL